jgi:hypothetical protein
MDDTEAEMDTNLKLKYQRKFKRAFSFFIFEPFCAFSFKVSKKIVTRLQNFKTSF